MLQIYYRYCIASTYKVEKEGEDTFNYAIKSWETNVQPRSIPENGNILYGFFVEKCIIFTFYSRF